ncbi:hypothetical protein D3C75_1299890 [compost metagenome]
MGFVLGVAAAPDPADEIAVASPIHTYHQHIHVIVAEGAGIALFAQLRQRQGLD